MRRTHTRRGAMHKYVSCHAASSKSCRHSKMSKLNRVREIILTICENLSTLLNITGTLAAPPNLVCSSHPSEACRGVNVLIVRGVLGVESRSPVGVCGAAVGRIDMTGAWRGGRRKSACGDSSAATFLSRSHALPKRAWK
jgi:hypothetical protein